MGALFAMLANPDFRFDFGYQVGHRLLTITLFELLFIFVRTIGVRFEEFDLISGS